MLVSMTGFGSSSYEDSSLSINIELKSFNSRYFELNTKSFDLSGPLEYKIRNYLKKFPGEKVSMSIKFNGMLESGILEMDLFMRSDDIKSLHFFTEFESIYKLDVLQKQPNPVEI